MRQHSLTVLIPCKNERRHILACIQSARAVASEILVADSGSTDGTLELARSAPDCRVIEREFIGYASFKNWALEHASHDWVLIVDADERVTPELAAEISKLLAGNPSCDAYRLRRDSFLLGHPIRHCGWSTSRITRLVRRSVCRYQAQRVHEEMAVSTRRVGTLEGRLLHYTAVDFDEFLYRQCRYGILAAQDAFERGRRPSLLKTFFHPGVKFFHLYVLQRGYRDGFPGLIVCLLMAFYAFVKDAKLWALAAGRPEAESLNPAPAGNQTAPSGTQRPYRDAA